MAELFWIPEREAEARKLFDGGSTASESASELTTLFQRTITRNSVIGLWHRRNWSGGATIMPKPRKPRQADQLSKRERVRVVRAPISAEQLAERVAEVQPLHVNLLDLQRGQCRYPYGDGPFTFCGCPAVPDRPYCEPHEQLCNGQHITYGRATAEKRKRDYLRTQRAA